MPDQSAHDRHLLPNDNDTNAYFPEYYNYHTPSFGDYEVQHETNKFLKENGFERTCPEGYVHYHMGGLTGGLAETIDEFLFKKKWKSFRERQSSFWCLKCSSLMEVLGIAGGQTHFDWFSLDVSGGELEALRTIDWDVFSAKIIVIQSYTSAVREKSVIGMLLKNGYNLLGDHDTNFFFVNKAWDRMGWVEMRWTQHFRHELDNYEKGKQGK